ncbi:MAG: RimK family alpha-L-glutamate ligase [Clostridiales bacterium]|nr:RimK family alpha-L-glutamate ligase [Clostridiales bacterium]
MSKRKKAIIIVNAYARELYTRQVRRIKDELEKRGVEVEAKRNGAFLLSTESDEKPDCDFIVYLDKDKYAARLLEKRNLRLFNNAAAIEVCDDKMLTHIALDGAGIKMPETIPGLLCYYDDATPDKNYLDGVERRLGYPVIVKMSHGSLGGGVFKADNRNELDGISEKVKLYPHLFQKYIASSHGRDMRVIVIGDEVVGGILRSSTGDFRSNIGLGGKAEKCDVPEDVAATALKIQKLLGLDYCGMDFLLGETPLLCEVNSNAFFDAFEDVTGLDVAGKYAEHIIATISK